MQRILAQRGAGFERVTTRARHGHFFVIGVNAGFHGNSLMGKFGRLGSIGDQPDGIKPPFFLKV
jgi:hypothetical protein